MDAATMATTEGDTMPAAIGITGVGTTEAGITGMDGIMATMVVAGDMIMAMVTDGVTATDEESGRRMKPPEASGGISPAREWQIGVGTEIPATFPGDSGSYL
jgi:hypothetical protein